jgi:hypothetical protein
MENRDKTYELVENEHELRSILRDSRLNYNFAAVDDDIDFEFVSADDVYVKFPREVEPPLSLNVKHSCGGCDCEDVCFCAPEFNINLIWVASSIRYGIDGNRVRYVVK